MMEHCGGGNRSGKLPQIYLTKRIGHFCCADEIVAKLITKLIAADEINFAQLVEFPYLIRFMVQFPCARVRLEHK